MSEVGSCLSDFFSTKVFRGGEAVNRFEAYDVDAASKQKRHEMASHIRKLVFRAWELGYAIVLENLDFEYAESTLGNKLGAALHTMPYKAIAAKFRRECLRPNHYDVGENSAYNIAGQCVALKP